MMHRYLFLVLCLIFTSSSIFASDDPVPDLDKTALIKLAPELRKGGYIFYFRHASTDHNQLDQQPVALSDCTTQRNLSDKGRRQSKNIGAAIRKLHIPIGSVISSPFCRCKDTATLAFGSNETNDKLFFAIGLKRNEKIDKAKYLANLLGTPFSERKNRVIVSHTSNLKESTGIWPKPEAVAYIFKPISNGNYQVIGRVGPDTWKNILK